MTKHPETPDNDSPEWSDEMFAEAMPMRKAMPEVADAFKRSRGRPKIDNPKQHIGMRLDADIVDWLRAHEGYNAMVNETLRREMQRKRDQNNPSIHD